MKTNSSAICWPKYNILVSTVGGIVKSISTKPLQHILKYKNANNFTAKKATKMADPILESLFQMGQDGIAFSWQIYSKEIF